MENEKKEFFIYAIIAKKLYPQRTAGHFRHRPHGQHQAQFNKSRIYLYQFRAWRNIHHYHYGTSRTRPAISAMGAGTFAM